MKKFLIFCLCITLLFLNTGCSESKANLSPNKELSKTIYSLGDNIGDYTVTDVNGVSYTFSDLLKTKKAIVLNFWFINCGPCQMEFPYLQEASDTYSQDVAVIAINPVDKKISDIQKYAVQNELTIPLVMGDNAWITAFGLQGYPTTVVIDKFGCVAFKHVGAITEKGVFEKIFDFFTNNSYKQTVIKNITDIK